MIFENKIFGHVTLLVGLDTRLYMPTIQSKIQCVELVLQHFKPI